MATLGHFPAHQTGARPATGDGCSFNGYTPGGFAGYSSIWSIEILGKMI
jgi:hypothetical protein